MQALAFPPSSVSLWKYVCGRAHGAGKMALCAIDIRVIVIAVQAYALFPPKPVVLRKCITPRSFLLALHRRLTAKE